MKGVHGSILGLWVLPLIALLGGDTSIASAQDEIPKVGLGAVHPICNSNTSSASSDEAVQDEMFAKLEADDEVVGARQDIEVGELLCDSLADAENAELLRFEIFANETVTAQRTSFTVDDAGIFTDGNGRKVWKGNVIDPPPADDTPPRRISMTWGTPCDVETFLLKMIDTNPDGTTSVTTSVPCDAGSSNQICMMQFDIDLPTHSDPVVHSNADGLYETEGRNRHLLGRRPTSRKAGRRRRSLDTNDAIDVPSRRLQDVTEVDVMVLYSNDGLARAAIGGVTAEQMETMIADELPQATEAAINSEIDLQFNLVHVAPLPYEQTDMGSSAAESELIFFTYDADVAALRDTYAADLVVLVGNFSGTCGVGWANTDTAPEDEQYGYSLIDARCFDGKSTTHEMGHNMGCLHDIDNLFTPTVNDYSHGMRYCTGTGTRFHTIMAYYCAYNPPDGYTGDYVPALNHFSNPDVSYLGVPTGTATANNAQTIRDNMEAVSRFRAKCQDDSDCKGTGTCVNESCGVTECESAGGNIFLAGDGYCASENNIAECGFDGGDCCECDCGGFGDVCGSDGYDCKNEFSDCYSYVEEEPATGTNTCDSLGIVAIEGTNDNGSVCCPEECTQCGGVGCAFGGAASGLDNRDCCINGVLTYRGSCVDSGEAPCVL